jgi:hypothetical protein
MDHRDVRAWLDEAVLEHRRLDEVDCADACGQALRAHLATCPECRGEYIAARTVAEALLAGLAAEWPAAVRASEAWADLSGDEVAGTVDAVASLRLRVSAAAAPPDLRDRTLAYVHAHGATREHISASATLTPAAPEPPAPRMTASPGTAPAGGSLLQRALHHEWPSNPEEVPEPPLELVTIAPARVPDSTGPVSFGVSYELPVTPARPTQPAESTPDRRFMRPGWLVAVAACLVLALLASAVAVGADLAGQRDAARADVTRVGAAAAAVEAVLRDANHQVVQLERPSDGSSGGSIMWSPASGNVVILATALDEPAGTTYRCWVEHGGTRTVLGSMWSTDGLVYWSGALADWGGAIEPGSTVGVSVQAPDGSAGPAVLLGQY